MRTTSYEEHVVLAVMHDRRLACRRMQRPNTSFSDCVTGPWLGLVLHLFWMYDALSTEVDVLLFSPERLK